MSKLPPAWKSWILNNLLRGVAAESLHEKLVQEGFSDVLIRPLLQGNLPDDFSYSEDEKFYSTLTQPDILQQSTSTLTNWSTPSFQIVQIDDLFSADECARLCAKIKKHLRPSDISTEKVGAHQSFRTSSTCDLPQVDTALSDLANQRILALFGKSFGSGEPIQAQHYCVGQEFKAHTDYFEPATSEYKRFASELGQRTWTCMVYLNDVEEGGETEFSHIAHRFTPYPGRALLWNNLNAQGVVNPASIHQAHPVIKGEKTVITKWLRTRC